MRTIDLYLIAALGCSQLLDPAIDTVQGATLHVRANATGASDGTDWENAFTDLQAALEGASAGDEIWIGAGTYHPSARVRAGGRRTATFSLPRRVALYGGFVGTETKREERDPDANVTTLSGDFEGDDGPELANNGENAYR